MRWGGGVPSVGSADILSAAGLATSCRQFELLRTECPLPVSAQNARAPI
jgi:hypothetical protein